MPSRRSGRPYYKSETGWESFPEGREGLGGPPRGPGGIGWVILRSRMGRRPTRRSERGRESYLEGWEWSGGYPEACKGSGGPTRVPGGVRRPTLRLWRVGKPMQRSGRFIWRFWRGRVAHSNVQKAHPEVQKAHSEF